MDRYRSSCRPFTGHIQIGRHHFRRIISEVYPPGIQPFRFSDLHSDYDRCRSTQCIGYNRLERFQTSVTGFDLRNTDRCGCRIFCDQVDAELYQQKAVYDFFNLLLRHRNFYFYPHIHPLIFSGCTDSPSYIHKL